jgi:hypothetical protein
MNARSLLLALVIASPALAFPSGKVLQNLHLLEASDSPLGLVAAPRAPALVGALELSADVPIPAPAVPADDGGGAGEGVRSSLAPEVALLISLIVGFGLGHLIAQDRPGFVTWLIVDAVIIVATSVIYAITPFWFLGWGGLGSLLLLASHIFQALDVYPKAGGAKLVDRARDQAILVSTAGRPDPAWPGAVRLLAASF